MPSRKVAVAQLEASASKADNLDAVKRRVSEAARRGASLVAFPEFMMFHTPSSQSPAQLARLAEPIDGPFVRSVAESAREHSVGVVCTMYERSPRRNRVYDTSFHVSKSGRLVSAYRKIHLYDALGFRESAKMEPGNEMPRPAASGVGRVGMMICYDLRFPETSRALAAAGSEVIVSPSAWFRGPSKEEHWLTMNKARAIENGCYVVSPDQIGPAYCGRSLVVDPYGAVLLDMGKRAGMGYADIDLGALRRTRRGLPLLRSRRTDLYAGFAG